MKIVKNEKLIERNSKLGNAISIGALAILGAGMYISFKKPEWFIYSIVCLVVGYVLTQIGMYMGNRWGRSPRPDEKIDAGLKGLHSDFNMYHYVAPAPHVLVGPAGIWVLIPFQQNGRAEFNGKRWKLSGGGFIQSYMKIFGQEGLGRPEVEANAETLSVQKFLEKNLEGQKIPEVRAMLVFTSDSIQLDAKESPIAAVNLKQLKEFMRQEAKNKVLSSPEIMKIASLFSS